MTEERASTRGLPFALAVAEDRVALAGVLGALAIGVGSALQWSVVPVGSLTITEYGLEANGKLTLIAGVLGLVFLVAALRLPGRDLPLAAGLAAMASGAIGIAYLVNVRAASARVLARLLSGRGTLDPRAVGTSFGAQIGAGVWIVIAGSAVLLGSVVALLVRDRSAASGSASAQE
jgi:hypothetical protein